MNVEMPKSSSFQRSIRIYEDDLQQLEQVRKTPERSKGFVTETSELFRFPADGGL